MEYSTRYQHLWRFNPPAAHIEIVCCVAHDGIRTTFEMLHHLFNGFVRMSIKTESALRSTTTGGQQEIVPLSSGAAVRRFSVPTTLRVERSP